YANPRYYFRYDSAEFQKLFQESETTVDDKARRELYVRIQKKLVEDAPVVWLYIHPRLAVTKKGVQGLWKDLPAPAFDRSEYSWVKSRGRARKACGGTSPGGSRRSSRPSSSSRVSCSSSCASCRAIPRS